jgi:hypothetical protein
VSEATGDDYSLNVEELAPVPAVEEAKVDASTNGSVNGGGIKGRRGGRRKTLSVMRALPLFAGLDGEKERGR